MSKRLGKKLRKQQVKLQLCEKLDPRLLKEVGDLDTANFHKSNRIAMDNRLFYLVPLLGESTAATGLS